MPLLRGVEGEDDVRLSTFVSLQTVSKPTMVYLVSAESSKLVNTCCKDDNCLSDICPALNAMKSVKASVSNPSVLSAGRDPVEVNVSGGGGFVALRWLLLVVVVVVPVVVVVLVVVLVVLVVVVVVVVVLVVVVVVLVNPHPCGTGAATGGSGNCFNRSDTMLDASLSFSSDITGSNSLVVGLHLSPN